ncbi:MAG: aldo/keto reductase [Phycisphaerae bacterium]
MNSPQKPVDRRSFLKSLGTAGAASAFITSKIFADVNQPSGLNTEQLAESPKSSVLPCRKLGKTGISIPVLANGVMFDVMSNFGILQANLMHGITYWDTAYSYGNGNSELGVGKFLKKHPEMRKKLFIVTKASGAFSSGQIEQRLQESLKRMNTDYIDMYYAPHGCSSGRQLSQDLENWVRSAKERGLIKYFGFSTHNNMADCLMAASKLDWIDAVMTTYNAAEMQRPQMQQAVQACFDAGIGVIAMKVILNMTRRQPDAECEIMTHFLEKGYTRAQALIKAVLSDERIASVCIRMEDATLLKSNVAAILDKTALTSDDLEALKVYSKAICSGYCAGCAEICEKASPEMPYVRDIMRYLMYHDSYGDTIYARELFAQIPSSVRAKLIQADYSRAEALCPQHMPISRLMTEAARKLA